MLSISAMIIIFSFICIVVLLMYIVYIHSEYNKIVGLYTKTVEEHKKLQGNLLEFNTKIDKLYKEISDLKVEKTKLADENKTLKSRVTNLKNITNKLREKMKEMQKSIY
jgi:predicted nuclease with TOPRIM domain